MIEIIMKITIIYKYMQTEQRIMKSFDYLRLKTDIEIRLAL